MQHIEARRLVFLTLQTELLKARVNDDLCYIKNIYQLSCRLFGPATEHNVRSWVNPKRRSKSITNHQGDFPRVLCDGHIPPTPINYFYSDSPSHADPISWKLKGGFSFEV